MKKESILYALLILLFVVLVIAIPACHAMRNWFSDETPWDYKSSVWVCEDPSCVLTVDGKGQASCTAGTGDNSISFKVDSRGNNVYFLTTDENGMTRELAHGDGDYSSKKFMVSFSEGFTLPGVFDEPISKLVFIRQQ